jgi:hypothetical protein
MALGHGGDDLFRAPRAARIGDALQVDVDRLADIAPGSHGPSPGAVRFKSGQYPFICSGRFEAKSILPISRRYMVRCTLVLPGVDDGISQ